MTHFFNTGYVWEDNSYAGIVISCVHCDSMTQAAGNWSSVHNPLNVPRWGQWPPSGYAMSTRDFSGPLYTSIWHIHTTVFHRVCLLKV